MKSAGENEDTVAIVEAGKFHGSLGVATDDLDVKPGKDLSYRRAAFALDKVLVEMGEIPASELDEYSDLVAG